MVEGLRWRRLRWRLRGAWQWPAFCVLTVVDAVLVALLPFSGEGTDVIGAFLVAGLFNVLAVALLAPAFGIVVRRRRRDLPFVVARDYAGTGVLVAITAVLAASGLMHREDVVGEKQDQQAVFGAVHDYVVQSEPTYMAGLGTLDTLRLEDEHYRACLWGAADERPLCLFVNTDQAPAGVTRDPSREPNTALRR
jgi:hypothetical protein